MSCSRFFRLRAFALAHCPLLLTAGYELSRRQGDRIFGPNHAATSFLSGPVAQLSGSLLWVPVSAYAP
jgi:hypothetical protein